MSEKGLCFYGGLTENKIEDKESKSKDAPEELVPAVWKFFVIKSL